MLDPKGTYFSREIGLDDGTIARLDDSTYRITAADPSYRPPAMTEVAGARWRTHCMPTPESARRVGFQLDTPRAGELGVVEDLLVDRAFVADPANSAEELATLSDVRPAVPHSVANPRSAAALARAPPCTHLSRRQLGPHVLGEDDVGAMLPEYALFHHAPRPRHPPRACAADGGADPGAGRPGKEPDRPAQGRPRPPLRPCRSGRAADRAFRRGEQPADDPARGRRARARGPSRGARPGWWLAGSWPAVQRTPRAAQRRSRPALRRGHPADPHARWRRRASPTSGSGLETRG